MKKTTLILIVIIIILGALGVGGWYFLSKKLPEGSACTNSNECETALKCANKICSSGKVNSSCDAKADCKTNFCVSNKCTEGKRNDSCIAKTDCSTNYCINGKCTEGRKDDACLTYKDCEKGLFCKNEACSEPPSYSQYFDKIVISKMKPMPPGPNNIPVPTTEFKTTDALEIDLVGVKPTTTGYFYYEIVDSVTGETVFSTAGNKQKLIGRDQGTGMILPSNLIGKFDLNIFYNDEAIYTTAITISSVVK